MQHSSTRRHAEIGKILLSDWDPIGVKNEPDAQDEYNGYVSVIDALIQQGASADVIADRLMQIAKIEMTLQPSRDKAISVAEKLRLFRTK